MDREYIDTEDALLDESSGFFANWRTDGINYDPREKRLTEDTLLVAVGVICRTNVRGDGQCSDSARWRDTRSIRALLR